MGRVKLIITILLIGCSNVAPIEGDVDSDTKDNVYSDTDSDYVNDSGGLEEVDTDTEYDTTVCNFETPCRVLTMFSTCEPACSYAAQVYLNCEVEQGCNGCDTERDVFEVACGWSKK
jgi:hypothetical protein